MTEITIALAKGRLAECAAGLFENAGIDMSFLNTPTRKLVFYDEKQKVKFFFAKPADVPTYVEYGAADIGIVGRDTIAEEGRALYEVMDLGFGKCSIANKKVATKYPHIAKEYFEHVKKESVEIIKLNGSVELAPIVGLSDVIVDIVESGKTLAENGLCVLETISDVSARMIVNRVSMKTKRERILELVDKMKEKRDESR